jgi:hypothetical protein
MTSAHGHRTVKDLVAQGPAGVHQHVTVWSTMLEMLERRHENA